MTLSKAMELFIAKEEAKVYMICFLTASTVYFDVNNVRQRNDSTVLFQISTENPISIRCWYDITLRNNPPNFFEVTSSGLNNLNVLHRTNKYGKNYLQYDVPQLMKTDLHVYRCRTLTFGIYVEVSLRYCKLC